MIVACYYIPLLGLLILFLVRRPPGVRLVLRCPGLVVFRRPRTLASTPINATPAVTETAQIIYNKNSGQLSYRKKN